MTVSIPKKKLNEVLSECREWINRPRTYKKRLQSLVGKLVHIANAIQHAGRFTGRLLSTLRAMKDSAWTTISQEARLNIQWFLRYAEQGNRVSLFSPETEYFYIKCDASLTGGGGNSAVAYYTWKFRTDHVKRYPSIHMLEALNLLVSYKTLAPRKHHGRLTVVLLTDNNASSFALSTGKTKDPPSLIHIYSSLPLLYV